MLRLSLNKRMWAHCSLFLSMISEARSNFGPDINTLTRLKSSLGLSHLNFSESKSGNYYHKNRLLLATTPTSTVKYVDVRQGGNSSATPSIPFLVLLVMSRPEAHHERMAIRRTWDKAATSCHVKIIFPFGGLINSTALYDALTAEETVFRDMFIFEDIADEYYDDANVTLAALALARRIYPSTKYFAKANDDVWLNFPKIIKLLKSAESGHAKDFIMGHFQRVESAETEKYYSRFTFFDTRETVEFALGHLWMLPAHTLDRLVRKPGRNTPLTTSVTDVRLTGEVREFLRIPARHVEELSLDLWDLSENVGCGLARRTLVHGVYWTRKYGFEGLDCLDLRCAA